MADKLTKVGEYRATERGYAGGELIEEGVLVPAGAPLGSWMRKADGSPALERAMDEALDPTPGDVDLTALSKPALEVMASDKGINVRGLSKDDLITAIKAAHDPKR